jgi:phosphoglycerate dehydrogenase-like enzyme
MGLVIASQFEDSFNEALRAHALRPTVIVAREDRPWDAANDADILLVRPTPPWGRIGASQRPVSWPGRVRWIHSGSVGVDFYPDWLLDAPLVSCARGVSSDEIADYVISAIYHHSKDLEAVRARGPDQWRPAPLGRIAGTTIGIIGLGDIGTAVARRALALGMRIVAARRRPLPSPVETVDMLDSLAAVVAAADHLVLALPATDATYRVIDAGLLAHARPTAHLINIARGTVLDQDALLAALDAGQLDFATLDVTDPEPLPADHPLWRHPRVRLTPHISSNYTLVRNVLLEKLCANLDRFARGEAPTDLVDPAEKY